MLCRMQGSIHGLLARIHLRLLHLLLLVIQQQPVQSLGNSE